APRESEAGSSNRSSRAVSADGGAQLGFLQSVVGNGGLACLQALQLTFRAREPPRARARGESHQAGSTPERWRPQCVALERMTNSRRARARGKAAQPRIPAGVRDRATDSAAAEVTTAPASSPRQ